MQVELSPADTVLDGDPAPLNAVVAPNPELPSPKGHCPQFSAHVSCGQTDRWIKMPLGREVGLGRGHIVPLPQRGTFSSQFSVRVYCRHTVAHLSYC